MHVRFNPRVRLSANSKDVTMNPTVEGNCYGNYSRDQYHCCCRRSRGRWNPHSRRRCAQKQSQKIHLAAVQAVIILQANGLNPDDDLATQTRLAAAVDRQITGKTREHQDEPTVARSIPKAFYLQETADARLKMASKQTQPAYYSR